MRASIEGWIAAAAEFSTAVVSDALDELGLKPGQIRELQALPIERLIAANTVIADKIPLREPGVMKDLEGKFAGEEE